MLETRKSLKQINRASYPIFIFDSVKSLWRNGLCTNGFPFAFRSIRLTNETHLFERRPHAD